MKNKHSALPINLLMRAHRLDCDKENRKILGGKTLSGTSFDDDCCYGQGILEKHTIETKIAVSYIENIDIESTLYF